MAEPQHFTSQQSEQLLNVSEDHSSSPLAAEPHAETHVEQSPNIQGYPGEACIPESAERIEDSYQESLGRPVPAPLTEDEGDEEEEDLYSVSPHGKAKLDTAVAAIKSTQEEQVWWH
jgi:hypothetical protein